MRRIVGVGAGVGVCRYCFSVAGGAGEELELELVFVVVVGVIVVDDDDNDSEERENLRGKGKFREGRIRQVKGRLGAIIFSVLKRDRGDDIDTTRGQRQTKTNCSSNEVLELQYITIRDIAEYGNYGARGITDESWCSLLYD